MIGQEGQHLRGELLEDVPMAQYCSWRAGGNARRLYRPADSRDLREFLSRVPKEESLLWVGLGSNLLVRDGGFNGTVVLTKGCLQEMRFEADLLRAEAGVTCSKAARVTAREGFVGLEFFAGIPGTVGGALAMNAGAFGGETWKQVETVETIDRYGCVKIRRPGDFVIGYREVKGPEGEWFLAARFRLQKGDVEPAQQRIRELLEKRADTQPTNQPSCGSTFRNPEGDHAARLIEDAGMKGRCIGGACVSEKHANFIINTGEATAADIERLVDEIQNEVEKRSGIELQREVHIVGEAA